MRKLVEQTLKDFGYYTPDSANLVLGTIAQESGYGKYHKQINGPALGICQMEPNTFNDIMNNYLRYHPDIIEKIKLVIHDQTIVVQDLITNDRLAICMCRVHYLRMKGAIPSTVEGYAQYWKQWYNTPLGAGTTDQFIRNYNLHVVGDQD